MKAAFPLTGSGPSELNVMAAMPSQLGWGYCLTAPYDCARRRIGASK
ncbi:hypothetical protein [Sinorhizobium meliloti]|nr:hypothetical protein [Sinorhizobium meliloti]